MSDNMNCRGRSLAAILAVVLMASAASIATVRITETTTANPAVDSQMSKEKTVPGSEKPSQAMPSEAPPDERTTIEAYVTSVDPVRGILELRPFERAGARMSPAQTYALAPGIRVYRIIARAAAQDIRSDDGLKLTSEGTDRYLLPRTPTTGLLYAQGLVTAVAPLTVLAGKAATVRITDMAPFVFGRLAPAQIEETVGELISALVADVPGKPPTVNGVMFHERATATTGRPEAARTRRGLSANVGRVVSVDPTHVVIRMRDYVGRDKLGEEHTVTIPVGAPVYRNTRIAPAELKIGELVVAETRSYESGIVFGFDLKCLGVVDSLTPLVITPFAGATVTIPDPGKASLFRRSQITLAQLQPNDVIEVVTHTKDGESWIGVISWGPDVPWWKP